MSADTLCPGTSRREARRQDRRDAILAVAAKSFLDNGYAGTTMSSIAAEMGGSKGTLWSYFPSKEALFEAVIDQVSTAFRVQVSEILDPCGDVESTLRRCCIRVMEKILSPDALALYRLVASEAGRFPEMGAIFYNRGPLRTWRLIADFLLGAMDRNLIRRDDPLEAARTLVMLCMANTQQQLLTGVMGEATPALIGREVDHALNIFMRAYATETAPPAR